MSDILRNSPYGRIVRAFAGSKVFPYPEEREGFDVEAHLQHDISEPESETDPGLAKEVGDDEKKKEAAVVTWYSPTDPDNPHNWSVAKKVFIFSLVCLLTFAIYSGSAIITPAEGVLTARYGLSKQSSLLVLSMYVLGYGTGPLFFSPASEVPVLGRNIPYMTSFSLFMVVSLAGALVDNYPGLVVLRFLQGFFGGPVLSTGAAQAGDIFPFWKLPYALASWALIAFGGPALGPVMSTYAVTEASWRWGMWETLILSGVTFVLMFFFMAETNPETILLWRAQRLRKLTGRADLKSDSEIKQSSLHLLPLLVRYTLTPFKTVFQDPSIAFTDLYTALIYGVYYSWFESFPIVYSSIHGFSVDGTSLVFISVIIGAIIGCTMYVLAIYFVYEPYTLSKGIGVPEHRLVPGLIGSVVLPIGIFIYAWTARSDISWVVPTIGVVLFSGSAFVIVQCIFLYLATSFPRHSASIFTGNGFLRSALACGAVHFSEPLFNNLGVGRGNSILGGLTAGCAALFIALWYFGPRLRERSSFAETY